MKAILTFQGFTESESRRSGTEDLFFQVIRKFAGPDVTTYHPRTWTTNVRHLADQIIRQGIRNVALVSYSHGQAAAMAFARIAYQAGISCDLWLCCDPVYRPTWAPRKTWAQVFAIRAMIGNPTIKIPPSVRRVVGVRQEINRPQACKLRAIDPHRTRLQKLDVLPYSHTAIDEAMPWYDLVHGELKHWMHPPKAEPT